MHSRCFTELSTLSTHIFDKDVALSMSIHAEEDDGKGRRKRIRTPTARLSYEPSADTPNKKQKQSSTVTAINESEEAIAATLDFQVGDEVFFKGKITDNEGFSGELLSINGIDGEGVYMLGMANPCSGLWGDHIWRRASQMKRHARRIEIPDARATVVGDVTKPEFIPIEFSLQHAVFDNRSSAGAVGSTCHADFVKTVLDGWHLADSCMDAAWTVPTHLLNQIWKSHKINYSIFYLVLKDFVENEFKPITNESYDAFFVLPPMSGSVQAMEDYWRACEKKEEKFVMSFEYVWIFVDKPITTTKTAAADG